MTTTTADAAVTTATEAPVHPDAITTLKGSFIPTKIHRHSLTTRVQLTDGQEAMAASVFQAQGDAISGGKILIDRKHPRFKDVTSVLSRVYTYWKATSLPYPEDGIRLIRTDRIEDFVGTMEVFKQELGEAVEALDGEWQTIVAAAQVGLGDLFDPLDYPSTVAGCFSIDWEFANVHPPEHLKAIDPAQFEREKQRMMARFEEATAMAEQAFMDEFAGIIERLTASINGVGDENAAGKPKGFSTKSLASLHTFFDRFKELNIHSSEQLDTLVDQAQQLVEGVDPKDIKGDAGLRKQLADSFSGVTAQLDQLLVARPKRKLIVE